MDSVFKLPKLGESVGTGIVAKILVNKGDTVNQDQNVLEIETGKAILELPSSFAGIVEDILIKEGDEVAVGQKLFLIAETGNKPAEPEPESEIETQEKKVIAPEPETRIAQQKSVSATTDINKKLTPAAPSVRKFARELGLKVEDIPGTGP
ncbi:MAG: biotin/lipoyl-containing protein, partial [Victivallaceae bacterium]